MRKLIPLSLALLLLPAFTWFGWVNVAGIGGSWSVNPVSANAGIDFDGEGSNEYIDCGADIGASATSLSVMWMGNLDTYDSSGETADQLLGKDDRTTGDVHAMFTLEANVFQQQFSAHMTGPTVSDYIGRKTPLYQIDENSRSSHYMVVFTWDGGTTSSDTAMYVNARAYTATFEGGTFTGIDDSDANFFVGAHTKADGTVVRYLDGQVDQFAFWHNVELTAAAVEYLFNGGRPNDIDLTVASGAYTSAMVAGLTGGNGVWGKITTADNVTTTDGIRDWSGSGNHCTGKNLEVGDLSESHVWRDWRESTDAIVTDVEDLVFNIDFSASDWVDTVSGKVSVVQDKASGIHLIQGTADSRPTLNSADQNSLNTITCDGTDDQMESDGYTDIDVLDWIAFDNSTAVTCYAVVAVTDPSGRSGADYDYVFGLPHEDVTAAPTTWNRALTLLFFGFNDANYQDVGMGNGAPSGPGWDKVIASATLSTNFQVFTSTFDGVDAQVATSFEIRQNNSVLTDGINSSGFNAANDNVGLCDYAGGSGVAFKGKVAQILCYREAHDGTEKTNVYNYLDTKWGLP